MIPLLVQSNLTEKQKINFHQRFGTSEEWDRSLRENVWRRHQAPENQELSDWRSGEHRRRLVHFRDKYGLVNGDFCLVESYLFLSIKAPQEEIESYKRRIHGRNLCGLKLEVNEQKIHEADVKAGRETPQHYSNLDVRLYSHQYSNETAIKPWRILKTGIRQKIPRGNPTSISSLEPFFPAQVELGCGPSIETGIPPLNFFHKLFSLHKNGKFVLKAEDDDFLSVFDDPIQWYQKAIEIHQKTLVAEPSSFYFKLKELHDQGKIVGPIINNNFDGLPLSVGLEELPLRKYDDEGLYPPIKFHPEAKSLLVIGAHADRRKCQHHARNAGLKIVYIDPEGYDQNGVFVSYPLESPQNEDYVMNIKASLI